MCHRFDTVNCFWMERVDSFLACNWYSGILFVSFKTDELNAIWCFFVALPSVMCQRDEKNRKFRFQMRLKVWFTIRIKTRKIYARFAGAGTFLKIRKSWRWFISHHLKRAVVS
ncbi:unnamed protein product [Albugo candida]|uniref:Uncharacterized protein n=1 Tax=Albugo candida TaxID=65357 RepID=A0A024GAS4_9STRA|nr:unnamed protein product [Albugo candida]|eukprot:CCI43655.1 unnamed protein product [Albugo candida]